MSDRRKYARRGFSNPVDVSTPDRKDRGGVARDLSPTGISFRTGNRYKIGDRVVIQFRTSRMVWAAGQVVRVIVDDDASASLPYLTAVQFDVTHFDLGASA